MFTPRKLADRCSSGSRPLSFRQAFGQDVGGQNRTDKRLVRLMKRPEKNVLVVLAAVAKIKVKNVNKQEFATRRSLLKLWYVRPWFQSTYRNNKSQISITPLINQNHFILTQVNFSGSFFRLFNNECESCFQSLSAYRSLY